MTVRLANPRGFCAGVDRAIEIVERTLERYGSPVYVLHEIVHNRHVLRELSARGVCFVEELDEVPDGSVTIFSAHGVPDRVESEAKRRGLHVIDATCPLVAKVHQQARRSAAAGQELIVIGHPGHPEVVGTTGRHSGRVHVLASVAEVAQLEVDDPEGLSYVTQTTLSIDDTREVVRALEARFPTISGPELSDICYATQNRQTAVDGMLGEVEALIVVGSPNSSNSNRLREMGERAGVPSLMVDDPDAIPAQWIEGLASIGLTAGASAPEALVDAVIARLLELGADSIEELDGPREQVQFRMPSEFVSATASNAI